MPKSKSFKKKLPKKSFKKALRKYNKKRVARPLSTVVLGQGFPKKLVATLRYADRPTLTSTAGVLARQQFSANSIYDPDVTYAGHQPMFHDQLTAIYDNYTVIGSRFRVRIVPTGATTAGFMAMLRMNDDTTLTKNTYVWSNLEDSKNLQRSCIIPTNSTDTSKWMSLGYSAKKWFGGSLLANKDHNTNTGSNPVNGVYYELSLQASDASATVSAYAFIEIEYIVVFNELKDIAQS